MRHVSDASFRNFFSPRMMPLRHVTLPQWSFKRETRSMERISCGLPLKMHRACNLFLLAGIVSAMPRSLEGE